MIFKRNTTILLTLLLFSCNAKKKKQETELPSKPIIKTEIKVTSKPNTDYSKGAELFALDVLQENLRIHKFTSNTKKPKYLSIFNSKNLDSITAYSNKNYPQKKEPSFYEHFTLFVLKYKNNESAQNSFDTIKSDSKYGWTDLNNLNGTIKNRVKNLSTYAKYGGMIIHKNSYIFSLVETCRETPIGTKWIKYENKFINFIIGKYKELEILNAHCGNDRFYTETRKISK